ncbi:iron permease [Noviherbaspirillum cavernae]|uniref:High-potential iron-sulfur protein n=1 Tax=Noviherbaspirillum cavernae TaxID=2320862 RepID=A0A418WWW0_9BURK|nr:high-potential iron-sulfur protein [Noviherbaspirillum cavernae]RJG04692.1 iron permease [Noviherbaspirillum cavernae]
MHKRRVILLTISAVTAASAAGIPLHAFGALQKIDPKDAQAVSLAYTDETTTVDKKKFPKHDNTQTCSNCQFYQTAQEAGTIAPCTIFGGKGVAAKGWCSAWVKKAG